MAIVNRSTLQTALVAIVAVTLWDWVKAKVPQLDPATYVK
jgi:hypothetical protein